MDVWSHTKKKWLISYHYKIRSLYRCHVILDPAELVPSTTRRIHVT